MIPKIEALMSGSVFKIDASHNVQEAAEKITRLNVGSLLVMREGNYVGMMTEVDIIRKVVAKKRQPSEVLVGGIMASPLISIEAHETIINANSLMEEKNIRHLVVTRTGKVVGVVSVRDFLHPLTLEESPEERVSRGREEGWGGDAKFGFFAVAGFIFSMWALAWIAMTSRPPIEEEEEEYAEYREAA